MLLALLDYSYLPLFAILSVFLGSLVYSLGLKRNSRTRRINVELERIRGNELGYAVHTKRGYVLRKVKDSVEYTDKLPDAKWYSRKDYASKVARQLGGEVVDVSSKL